MDTKGSPVTSRTASSDLFYFDLIAAEILRLTIDNYHPQWNAIMRVAVDQLRQVWNARGAADMAAFTDLVVWDPELVDDVTEAFRALDKPTTR